MGAAYGAREAYESMREDFQEIIKIFKNSESCGNETLTQGELDEVRNIAMVYEERTHGEGE